MAQNQKWRRQSLKTYKIQKRKLKKFFSGHVGVILPNGHSWQLCEMCGYHVRCGICGNNCCNGGSGKSSGRHETCDCEEAYEIQSHGYNLFCFRNPRHITKHERDRNRRNKIINERARKEAENIIKQRVIIQAYNDAGELINTPYDSINDRTTNEK